MRHPAAFVFGDAIRLFGTRPFVMLASSLCVLAQFPLNGCSKPTQTSSDVGFQYESQPNPARVGSNAFVVRLSGKDGAALSGAHISLEGDMSHPGMSPAFGAMKEVEAGTYRGDINLGMHGDWFVEFHIVLPDGRKVEREADLRNVKE
jgi:hypothetical protein